MDTRFAGILFMLALIASLLFTGYFFSLTGISATSFLTVNTIPLIKGVVSLPFLLAVLFASLAGALVLVLGETYDEKTALFFTLAGYVLGAGATLIIFNLGSFWAPFVGGIIALPFGARYIKAREQELKYLKQLRSATSGIGRILLIMSASFFVYLLVIGYLSAPTLKANFTNELLAGTTGGTISLGDQFSNQLAGALITQQTNTITTIQQFPELEKLVASGNADAVLLAQKIQALKNASTSPTMQQKIRDDLVANDIDIGQSILSQLPIITLLAESAWILYALASFTFCLFIGNLLVKNFAALMYEALVLLLGVTPSTTEAKKKDYKESK